MRSISAIDTTPKLLIAPISHSAESIKINKHENNHKLFQHKAPYNHKFDLETKISDNEIDFHKNQKLMYRSNSSRTFKRPKQKVNLGYEFDQIYFISSNKDDEHYDSIDVIDERRRKILINLI